MSYIIAFYGLISAWFLMCDAKKVDDVGVTIHSHYSLPRMAKHLRSVAIANCIILLATAAYIGG